MHRLLSGVACLVLAAVMFCGQSEARPRDPVGQFFVGIGKAFERPTKLRTKSARYSAKTKRHAETKTYRRTKLSANVPAITVHPAPADGVLMPGAADKFDPPLAELYHNFPVRRPAGWSQTGVASWYGPGFHGRRTACGQIYNEWGMTAAHRSLKCGTVVDVHSGGKVVTVTITDRGPYVGGRILDLSRGAARDLGIIDKGTATVTLFVLGKD